MRDSRDTPDLGGRTRRVRDPSGVEENQPVEE
jgi:hypothetical protein